MTEKEMAEEIRRLIARIEKHKKALADMDAQLAELKQRLARDSNDHHKPGK
jgi:hypothetical protein